VATVIQRRTFDFLAKDYRASSRQVKIIRTPTDASGSRAQPKEGATDFAQRWYLSLQGEVHPLASDTVSAGEGSGGQKIYRYDWTFGIALIEGFWWDWMADICKESAIAVHIIIEQAADAPEAIPVAGTLSALHPSKNTKSAWDVALRKMPKTAAEMAEAGASFLPLLGYVAKGFTLASNILESSTENQKNWFLYQFLDERLKAPTVEWRISKQVLKEYGPLLRGSLYLAFGGSPKTTPGIIKLRLRPQVRFFEPDDILYIVPTDALGSEEQVCIDVKLDVNDAQPSATS